MRFRLEALFSCLLLCLLVAGAQEPAPFASDELRALDKTLTALAAHGETRTVGVLGALGMGTGAVVSPEGRVLTNAHVAAGARYAVVIWADGRKGLARLLGISFYKDLALLELIEAPKAPLPFFELASEGPELTDFVAALGHPGGIRADFRPAFSFGRVNRLGDGITVSGFLDYTDGIETDIPLFNGNSGGPLFNLDGKLVGINGAVSFDTPSAFAVSLENLHKYLPELENGLLELNENLSARFDNPLVERIFRLVDRFTLESLERSAASERLFTLSEADWQARKAAAELAREQLGLNGQARRTPVAGRPAEAPRDRVLEPAFAELLAQRAPQVLTLYRDGVSLGYATALSAQHLVTKASGLGGGALEIELLGARHAVELVAQDDEVDLALLALPEALLEKVSWEVSAFPVPGQLIVALGHQGPAACGAVSTLWRRVAPPAPDWVSGQRDARRSQRLLKGMLRLARALRSELLVELIESYQRSQELQGSYDGGNTPRAYEQVLQHDAPIGSDEVGTPLIDVEGRLVGINVARAFQGTNYAAPAARALALLRLVEP